MRNRIIIFSILIALWSCNGSYGVESPSNTIFFKKDFIYNHYGAVYQHKEKLYYIEMYQPEVIFSFLNHEKWCLEISRHALDIPPKFKMLSTCMLPSESLPLSLTISQESNFLDLPFEIIELKFQKTNNVKNEHALPFSNFSVEKYE